MEINYLIESKEIEHEILGRFDQFLNNFGSFLWELGINPAYSWYLIEIQTDQLVSSVIGDVDILAGGLEFSDPEKFKTTLEKYTEENPDTHASRIYNYAVVDLVSKGGLKWIPAFDYLVGIEVKCSYLPFITDKISEDDLKAKKSSDKAVKGIRQQVDKLLGLGFNKVGLFEFIANPPAQGLGSKPWNLAAWTAGQSLNAMSNIFEKRLPENSPVGHGVSSLSGVLGRNEDHSGVYEYSIFRHAQDNPRLLEEQIKANRREMEQNLAGILQKINQPRNVPPIFVRDRKTGEIRFLNEGVIRG